MIPLTVAGVFMFRALGTASPLYKRRPPPPYTTHKEEKRKVSCSIIA
jgi:hypothetical protein